MTTGQYEHGLAGHYRAAIDRTHSELIQLRASLLRISDDLLKDGKAGAAARIQTDCAIISRMASGLAADLDGE